MHDMYGCTNVLCMVAWGSPIMLWMNFCRGRNGAASASSPPRLLLFLYFFLCVWFIFIFIFCRYILLFVIFSESSLFLHWILVCAWIFPSTLGPIYTICILIISIIVMIDSNTYSYSNVLSTLVYDNNDQLLCYDQIKMPPFKNVTVLRYAETNTWWWDHTMRISRVFCNWPNFNFTWFSCLSWWCHEHEYQSDFTCSSFELCIPQRLATNVTHHPRLATNFTHAKGN